ncbi:MAG: cation diffusion facilitator family transporter, partial [Frankiales bacterium]|nr:cation diffusion facilitator family transporter [Frankiales bacterium]
HGHSGHAHGPRSGTPQDRRYLVAALVLIVTFMLVEVVVGLLVSSLALLSDAGHMLTDAASLALALVAARLASRPARGNFTYGLKRVEILSAQANGLTLWLLAIWFTVEGIRRLVDPADVSGGPVLAVALLGIGVNLLATWLVSRADRTSLNVEGAFQHLLNDLFAFVATAVAGLVVLLTGWARADAVAALIVAALMAWAGWGLLSASWRIFLEAAPRGLDVAAVAADLRALEGVLGVHDLHVWEVTSGFPALSAHVLVAPDWDCHDRRRVLGELVRERYGIEHATLQVDHPQDDLIAPDQVRQRARSTGSSATHHEHHEH